MPIFYGKSRDGSDMKEFEGMHTSPNGKYWGNKPISLEEEKQMERELEGSFTQRLYKKLNSKKG
jgi:hypothetical protein